MLRAFVPDADETLVPTDVTELAIPAEGWIWYDVIPESREDVEELGVAFALHHHAIEDASTDTHFPKVDDFEDHVFVVLHGVAERGGLLETVELDAFLGRSFLLTVHDGPSPTIEWVLERANKRASSPDVVLARLAESSARRLLPLIESLDDTIYELEERALGGDGSVVADIQALRRDAIRLRRVVGPQREVLASLSRPMSPLIGNRAQQRFASAHDHLTRVVEHLDAARTLLSSTLETYRGAVAEKMNEVMKVLTVYAAILLPLTLLAGIYGMNFSNMPELGWRWGYLSLLGIMAVLAVGQWIYFARRGFVGSFSIRRIPRTVGRGLARLVVVPIDAAAKTFSGSRGTGDALLGMSEDETGSDREEAG